MDEDSEGSGNDEEPLCPPTQTELPQQHTDTDGTATPRVGGATVRHQSRSHHYALDFPARFTSGLGLALVILGSLVIALGALIIGLLAVLNSGLQALWNGILLVVAGGIIMPAAKSRSTGLIIGSLVMCIITAIFLSLLVTSTCASFIMGLDSPLNLQVAFYLLLAVLLMAGMIGLVISVLTAAISCKMVCCRHIQRQENGQLVQVMVMGMPSTSRRVSSMSRRGRRSTAHAQPHSQYYSSQEGLETSQESSEGENSDQESSEAEDEHSDQGSSEAEEGQSEDGSLMLKQVPSEQEEDAIAVEVNSEHDSSAAEEEEEMDQGASEAEDVNNEDDPSATKEGDESQVKAAEEDAGQADASAEHADSAAEENSDEVNSEDAEDDSDEAESSGEDDSDEDESSGEDDSDEAESSAEDESEQTNSDVKKKEDSS